MKKLFLPFFLFIAVSAFSENWNAIPETAKHKISFDSEYSFASNCISNQFALDYYRGVFLTNERKDDVTNQLSSYNRFGLQYHSRIAYSAMFDSLLGLKNSWLTFSLSDNFQVSSAFKKDAFELYFRGNKNYEAKKADLSHFNLNQFRFKQFSIGFGHQFTKNKQFYSFYTGLSLIQGNDLLTIHTNRASIFTAPAGEFLTLDADMTIQRSDSSARTWNAWKGTGAGMDFQFNWTDSMNNQFSVGIFNFGFISWKNRSSYIHADTTFDFTGVDVTQLFDFTETVKSSIDLDSALVQPYLKERSKKSITTFVPGRFVVSYTSHINNRLMLNITADQYWVANYLPSVVISPGYHLPKQTFWLTGRFGGYGKFFAGIAYQFHANNWEINVRSEYLSGMLSPKGRGQGLSIALAKSF